MIATITVNSHRTMPAHEAYRFSLNSNSAGGPLPLIPRRFNSSATSSPRPPLTASISLPASLHTLSASSSTATVSSSSTSTAPLSTQSSPHDSDSSSSSSSGTRPTIRPKRIRGVRVSPVRPPELSTPVPTLSASISTVTEGRTLIKTEDAAPRSTPPRPLLYTPGMSLRLSKDSLKSRNVSESHVSLSVSGSKSATCETFEETRIIRKKSGQLVKPSLKTSRSGSRNNLSILTASISSKSEPTTPTSKAVHFDAKLEHVKLFLAEQKPLAVSRDGSPTDDTSGTDSDFPKFIYGEGEDRRPKKQLVMQVANMPAKANPNSDVALEDLSLAADGTNIVGRVRVRNLAYSKWVAVRFTFDSWQTTSEVVGRYIETISPEFDCFTFTIRLNDLLARIEGKTLILAIRYSIEGREMWDNNSGQNYHATFTKAKVEERRRATFSDDEASDIADLQSKLEKVVDSKDRTGPAFFQISRRHSSNSSTDSDISTFRSTASLAPRYDFATSLKSPWRPQTSPPLHNRTQSLPLSSSKTANAPWSPKGHSDLHVPKRKASNPLRSPREVADDISLTLGYHQSTQADDSPFHPNTRTGRNHQRGYFDLLPGPSSVKRTPPGSPRARSLSPDAIPSRSISFSPPHGKVVDAKPPFSDISPESDISTPSMTTPSSSRSSTPSPSDPFPTVELPIETERMTGPDNHYRQFIDKFCFFTGPHAVIEQEVPRTHSASEIEEFLSGLSSGLDAPIQNLPSPTRSSSLDDLMLSRSGSITPTVSSLSMLTSQNTTPILS